MTSHAGSRFVYVIFIRTTPEELWTALTSAEFMRQYWFDMHIKTDWQTGSPWELFFPDGRMADTGKVIEADPPRRLVLTWRHAFRPELAAEGDARCVMELEPTDGTVKLTITHTMERPDSQLIQAVSGGWPRILSNLKSLLETGKIILHSRR